MTRDAGMTRQKHRMQGKTQGRCRVDAVWTQGFHSDSGMGHEVREGVL